MNSYRMMHGTSTHRTKSNDSLRCTRRQRLHQPQVIVPGYSQAVARRNERERNRVRLVNMGFAALRQHVPNLTQNKKMSKVDTLRSAVDYIKSLQELLQHGQPRTSTDEPDWSLPNDELFDSGSLSEDDQNNAFKDDPYYGLACVSSEVQSTGSSDLSPGSKAALPSAAQLDCYCGADDSDFMTSCQPWLM